MVSFKVLRRVNASSDPVGNWEQFQQKKAPLHAFTIMKKSE